MSRLLLFSTEIFCFLILCLFYRLQLWLPRKCRKDPSSDAGDTRDLSWIPWVRKMAWRREWLPTPVFFPGASHRRRSLAGNSPWGHRESDMIEQLIFPLLLSIVFIYSASFNWALNPKEVTSRLMVPCLENISSFLTIFTCNVFFWKALTIQVKMQCR